MYSGIKAVSLSNQSRVKGVRERPWIGRIPGEKRYSLASSLLPSRSRCGILSCKRLVTSYDGEILKKSLWKIWKRDKVCLIFAPAKTERGRRDEGMASSRGGGVLAMLTTIFPGGTPLNGGARKKVWKNFGKDLEGMIKTPYLCTRFRSWKSDGDEDDKKSSLTILTWK